MDYYGLWTPWCKNPSTSTSNLYLIKFNKLETFGLLLILCFIFYITVGEGSTEIINANSKSLCWLKKYYHANGRGWPFEDQRHVKRTQNKHITSLHFI